MKKKGPLRTVREGSVTVPIYSSTTRTGDSFVVAWYEGSSRKRRSFSGLPDALAFAQKRAKELARLGTATLAISGEDLLIYRRAKQMSDALGVPIDILVSECVEAKKALGDIPFLVAAREYALLRPAAVTCPPVSQVIEEFLVAKRSAGRSNRHLEDLSYRLGRFRNDFKVPMSGIRVSDVEKWLDGLDANTLKRKRKKHSQTKIPKKALMGRTRSNYLTAVTNLIHFAERRGYLAKGWVNLSNIERTRNEGEVAIFSPDELKAIMIHARPELVPFLAVCAFAGLRHAEASRLDWSEITDTHIDIKAAKAKTRGRRLVPVHPALMSWLAPYRQASGPICPFTKIENQIASLAQQAGVKWKRNGLRHSYGTYRMALSKNEAQVALEMGNTPQMVFAHYRAIAGEKAAEEWFQVAPALMPDPAFS